MTGLELKLKKIFNTDPDYSDSIARELMSMDNSTKSELFAII